MPTTLKSSAAGWCRPRLGYFVLASLVLHAPLVVLWQSKPPAGPVGQSTFHVTLIARYGDTESIRGVESGQIEKSLEPQPAKSSNASSEHSDLANPAWQKHPAVTTYVATTQRVTQAAADAMQSAVQPGRLAAESSGKAAELEDTPVPVSDKQAARGQISATNGSQSHGQHKITTAAKYQRVRAALYEALLPYFEYPSVARRRGWQGRVKVGLHVAADGDLSHIKLLESSGYALLDKAAMKNVTRLRNVPGATQWLDSSGMEVVLPVSYRLDSPRR